MTEAQLFCTFSVAGLSFAIDVQRVQEVISHLEVTRVPLAAATIIGLINLRGQIIPAIEARESLGLENRPVSQSCVYLILRTNDGLVSLLVDDIGGVLEFGSVDYQPPPVGLKGRLRDLVAGTYTLPGTLLLVLEIDRLVTGGSEKLSGECFDQAPLLNPSVVNGGLRA
ncbi:MAG: chemotaxis protein CheW [Candidatus Acidiferrum sp.]